MTHMQMLATTPDAVTQTAGLLTIVDDAFMVGFGRLGAEHLRALASLGAAFNGSPLEARVTEALAAVRRNEFMERHFVSLAVARAALMGAQHDALSAQLARALGREVVLHEPVIETETQAAPAHHELYLESTRQWLMEIALSGFAQLGPETLLPFAATLEKVQSEPKLVRLAALLTGFLDELVAVMTLGANASAPARRWVDLWARAMVLAAKTPPPATHESVSGTFHLLGVDLRQHGFFASAVFHGLLVANDEARHVRATLSQFKVEVVFGPELFRLLSTRGPRLVQALVEKKQLTLDQMTLTKTGELLWDDEKSSLGDDLALGTVAEAWLAHGASLVRSPLLGWDRHPAQIAEPVLITGHSLVGEESAPSIRLADGTELPIATERMAGDTDFALADLAAGPLIGLARYDLGAWRLQPLTLLKPNKKSKQVEARMAGTEAACGKMPKGAALEILERKAGKLLRAKS